MYTSICATSKKACPGKEERFGSRLAHVQHADSPLGDDDASPGPGVAPDAGKAELLIRCSGLKSLLPPEKSEKHACQQGTGADM